ncbi:MAG: hypothetical protein RIT27_1478 [Pseudomonadota bacterium]
MSTEIYGEFKDEEQPECEEYLSIRFSPSRLPLKKRWENNGLSADFIADYFKIFYVSQQEENSGETDEVLLENLRDSVKYVANELLENAMKFQAPIIYPTAARIFLSLYEEKLVFYITHSITNEQAELFEVFIKNLLHHDAQDLYMEAMRASAREENVHRSGMGLLSMICDHNAKLGWKFESIDGLPLVTVTTMVTLETDN